MPTLVLLRHGQSQWNLENRFTGWVDVDLTDQGLAEAREAGALLRAAGLHFDAAHTSVLKRAIRTLSITMDALDQNWVPVTRSWRLNERHYGALQGLNKAETTEKHGEEQVTIWRRSYATPPPPMSNDDPGHPRNEARYAHLDPRVLPATESLATTLDRVLPYWHDVIAPQLRAGQTILVTAHGNSLRALYKYLLNVAESDIVGVNIPTGVPLKFELNQELEVTDYGYLGDAQAAAAKAAAVANQAKA